MAKDQLKHVSKFLSLVLRHQPEVIGVQLDSQGWVSIEELIGAAGRHGKQLNRELITEVVANNDKQRFSISDDGQRIRANQGHSVNIELGLSPAAPPKILFHGTVQKFIESIREKGLIKGSRQHVHLSADRETAEKVAQRRGKPIILPVDSEQMNQDEFQFYLSENGVWLTDHVPAGYLTFPEEV